MPPRKCTRTITSVTRPNKRITLPIAWEQYQLIVADVTAFRAWLDGMIHQFPVLFPPSITQGYTLHDVRSSRKLGDVHLRRICLTARTADGKQQVFTIAPSGVLPYLSGYTDDVEPALFLRRFGVPFWALTRVFGHNDAYWYRLETHFGSYTLVSTTVKDPAKLPQHLVADEKITWLNGEEVEVATTVGEDCVLGASVALRPDTENLTSAYQIFQEEAKQVDPHYAPKTVNTDGWHATKCAWRSLFPLIVIIECFLHAWIKIRGYCRNLPELMPQVAEQVWNAYHAADALTFRQRVANLGNWAQQNTTGSLLEAIRKLCGKVERFVLAYDHPHSRRTSTMLDRQMDALSRHLDSARFFHGHGTAAERAVRAWALLHNFRPYCPRAKVAQAFRSPFHKLNGFLYHDNWLHNLLIATSMSGIPK